MLSLIHSKNISSPHFKANDSLTQHSKILSPKAEPQRQNNIRPNPILSIDTGTVLTSPNMSFTSHTTPSQMQSYNYEKPTLSLPSPKNPLYNPVISITSLYSPKEADISLHHSRSASTIPQITFKGSKGSTPRYLNISSPDVSPDVSPRQLCNTTTVSILKKKSSQPIIKQEESPQPKFAQYLGYLSALNERNPKDKFEKRLRGKNAEKTNKLASESRVEGSTLIKLPSYFAGVSSMLLNPKSNSQLHLSTQANNLSNHHSRKSSIFQLKKQASARLLQKNSHSESQPSLSEVKEVSTPNSQNKKSVVGFTYKAHMFGLVSKQQPSHLKVLRSAEHDQIFHGLSMHLQDLYQIIGNEQKMLVVLEKLADYNPKIIDIIIPKFHKINDYDANKLEQKFAMIEVVTESLSIPIKLQKKRDGITLIEPAVMDAIHALNKKIEEFNVLKKNEQLKVMEDRILQSQLKLQELHHRKYQASKRFGTRMPINDVTRNRIVSNVSQDEDPLLAIDTYQKIHGEFKHLSKRNMEHARKVNEVFSKWVQGSPHLVHQKH